MAEPRRIAFETVKPASKDKHQKSDPPSHRFSLRLGKSDDKTYSEYSYNDLVKSVSKQKKCDENNKNHFGDDSNDDSNVRDLARKFEEKYGPKPGKRKKYDHWEDYIDKGLGYDETDPFIDNDEAYDELVPSSLTTQHGGFYINLGELAFRAVSSESDYSVPFDPTKKRKKRKKYKDLIQKEFRRKKKMIIKDDDDDDDDIRYFKRKEKLPIVVTNDVLNSSHVDGVNKKIKTSVVDTKQMTNSTPAINNHLLPSPVAASSVSPVCTDADIQPAKENLSTAVIDSTSSDSNEFVMKSQTDQPRDIPNLPQGLPIELHNCVDQIKKAALTSAEGKCKFFTNEVNNLLLHIELKSRELTCSTRSMIYSHLASHLPCTKETLQKRAKKLRMDQEDGKLREPMQRLRQAVNDVMPAQRARYAKECQAAAAAAKCEENINSKANGVDKKDEDDRKSQVLRRKFYWTDHVRLLLCQIVSLKLKCFEVMKARTQTVEEYLRQFLESEVKDIWPAGWMNSRILMRESKSVYFHLSKAKKLVVVQKKINSTGATVVNMVTTAVTTAVTSTATTSVLLKSEPTHSVSGDTRAVTKTVNNSTAIIKNTSLSLLSETAALPSISKLIQQTKVSSYPETNATVYVKKASDLPTNNIIELSSKANDFTPLPAALSILSAPNHSKNASGKPSVVIVESKVSNVKPSVVVGNDGNNLKSGNKVSVVKTENTKSDYPKASSKVKSEQPLSSLISAVTSKVGVCNPKDITQSSSAIDVLDQIISASLSNFNKSPCSADAANSSKLVDDALSTLKPQVKSTSAANVKTTSLLNVSRISVPAKSLISGVSIPNVTPSVQKSPARSSVNQAKHNDSQNMSDQFFKNYEKYLQENSLTHMNPTSIQSMISSTQPVDVKDLSILTSTQSKPLCTSVITDPAAPFRSSYGFHEAFMNSLSATSSVETESSNVIRSCANQPNFNKSKMPTSSGIMKKQDFFSQNRAASNATTQKLRNVDNYSKVVGTYPSASHVNTLNVSSTGNIGQHLPSSAPFSSKTCKSNTIYTTSAQSLASIVNLSIEKPARNLSTSNAKETPKINSVIQMTSDFGQDGLACGLLQHASSFPNERRTANHTKMAQPPDKHSVSKYSPSSKFPDDVRVASSSHSLMSRNSLIRKDLGPYSTVSLLSKPGPANSGVDDITVQTFRLPSPTFPSHHSRTKSPVAPTSQSLPYPHFVTPSHHSKSPHTLPQYSPTMTTHSVISQPSAHSNLHQISPSSSPSRLISNPSPPKQPLPSPSSSSNLFLHSLHQVPTDASLLQTSGTIYGQVPSSNSFGASPYSNTPRQPLTPVSVPPAFGSPHYSGFSQQQSTHRHIQ